MTNLFSNGDFMRKQFHELDRDGDGFITESDLKACIRNQPVHSCSINCFFRRYDKDGDRRISFEEYRNGLLAYIFQNIHMINPRSQIKVPRGRTVMYRNEQAARSLFQLLDTDKSGSISTRELYQFFQSCVGQLPQEYVADFLEGLDANKDGEISESEFLTFVRSNWQKRCSCCAKAQQHFMPNSMR